MTDSGLKLGCEVREALDLVVGAVERQGLRAVRSFELQDALEMGGQACPCPYHGTDQCTCNYVVLSVFASNGDGELTGRVVLHGSGEQTWLDVPALDAREDGPDTRLLRALAELVLACSCSEEARVS